MRKERKVTGLGRQIKKNMKSGNRELAKRRESEEEGRADDKEKRAAGKRRRGSNGSEEEQVNRGSTQGDWGRKREEGRGEEGREKSRNIAEFDII